MTLFLFYHLITSYTSSAGMTTQDTLAFLLANSEEFELDSDDEISIAATLCNLQDNQYVMDYKKYPHFDLEKYSNEEFVKQF